VYGAAQVVGPVYPVPPHCPYCGTVPPEPPLFAEVVVVLWVPADVVVLATVVVDLMTGEVDT
jgi:hypothetical protein